MKKVVLALVFMFWLAPNLSFAEESNTDVGVYLFASAISGEAGLGNVTADVDLSFGDIVENLDIGFMAYIDHRWGKWSFIGDIAYLKLEDENSTTVGRATEVDLDAELTQTVLEGFAGYRVYESASEGSDIGIDILFGARHTTLDINLDTDANLKGFSRSGSRSNEEDWVDAVIGARVEADYHNGWGSMLWLDIGDGSDSSSRQLLAMGSYQGSSNWKFFGGYRFLNLEFESGSGDSTFAVDLDYSGPMFGATYRM
jgi:hypothetical protein